MVRKALLKAVKKKTPSKKIRAARKNRAECNRILLNLNTDYFYKIANRSIKIKRLSVYPYLKGAEVGHMARFCCTHLFYLLLFLVPIAEKMEKAMNEIKGCLFVRISAMLGCILDRNFWADKDIAQ